MSRPALAPPRRTRLSARTALAAVAVAVMSFALACGGGKSGEQPATHGASASAFASHSVVGTSTATTSTGSPTVTPTIPASTPTATASPTPAVGGDSNISYGATVSGQIATTGAGDQWTFEAAAGDVVTIQGLPTTGAACRASFELDDPSGSYIEDSNHDYTDLADRIINEQLKFAGMYEVHMDNHCGTDGLGYSLILTKHALAKPIAVGGSDTFGIALDKDYIDHTIDLRQGESIAVGIAVGTTYPGIYILDPSGAEADYDGANCYVKPQTVTFTAKFPGTYVLRVYKSCGSTGPYSVNVASGQP